jgi:hypothetical protein
MDKKFSGRPSKNHSRPPRTPSEPGAFGWPKKSTAPLALVPPQNTKLARDCRHLPSPPPELRLHPFFFNAMTSGTPSSSNFLKIVANETWQPKEVKACGGETTRRFPQTMVSTYLLALYSSPRALTPSSFARYLHSICTGMCRISVQ